MFTLCLLCVYFVFTLCLLCNCLDHSKMSNKTVIVVGGGVMGLSSCLELRRRGYQVKLLEASTIAHDLSTSADTSRLVCISLFVGGCF